MIENNEGNTLRERQVAREQRQYQEGIERYREESGKQEIGDQKAGRGIVAVAAKAMIPIVAEEVRKLECGDVHPSHVPLAYHYLLELDTDAVCAIAARVCVSASYKSEKLTRTAIRLASLIEDDYRLDELVREQPALANNMERSAKKRPSASVRRKIMRTAARIAGIKRMGWDETAKLNLGTRLIEVFVQTTGFAALQMEVDGKKTPRTLVMHEEVLERIKNNHIRLEADRPVNVPMICPPVPWTDPTTGGYITQLMQGKTPLVRKIKYSTRDDLFSSEMPEVYSAVNTVQATRWCINTAVLDVLNEAHTGNGSLAGLPQMDDQPVPDKPHWLKDNPKMNVEKDGTDEQKASLKEWKQAARLIHDSNATLRSKRLSLLTKLEIAKELRDEEAIWFPHSLDFRGRVYSMTAELSPQSDDVSKSLLQFADGKQLGDTGGYWLAVHVANLFGIDKVSFDDRVAWTVEHTKQIMDSAMMPLDGHRFWCEADDPWCALAACFEWTGFQIEGDDYVSHLPIAMDGSCSGIQHFSAMLRDAEGGKAVNLTKTDAPMDIYTEVLSKTKDLLAKNPEPLAKVWMDKLDRKIVKRPCMTFAYSVTSIGIRDQIADEMRKDCEGEYLPGHVNWQAAAFLAPIVEEAIRSVVNRAAEAMDWLKEISRAYSSEEIPAMWVTPLGFPVVQPYRKHKGIRITMWFNGVRIKLSLSVELDDVDKRKHTSSIAPNFVHSMDATHLMMVANTLHREGITSSCAMIHDSFGVHACDVNALHEVVREEFITLYSEDVLTKMYQSCLLSLPGDKWPDVPTPPEAGSLDLEEVRNADFFFA